MNHTIIAIDIAKTSFHAVSIKHNSVRTDRAFTRQKLKEWLAKQPTCLVVIEACGSAHYWARYAKSLGHKAQLIAPKYVKAFRQGHKTDKNDALAIAIASQQPKVKSVAIKTVEQQGLQSIDKIIQHLTDNQTAVSNMLRGLLGEFGIVIPKGISAFKARIPDILEDAENGLPHPLRQQIALMFYAYLDAEQHLINVEQAMASQVKQQSQCQQLMALEGVGPKNAMRLYLALGAQGKNFSNGREASACIGLTPKQYSTGGVTTLGGIGKNVGNKRLRSSLIQGAMAVVKVVDIRAPKNHKEIWLKQLIERVGKRRAAVALANKTIRTAWAMLNHDDAYQLPQAA